MDLDPEDRDFVYLVSIGEVLERLAEYVEEARHAPDDVMMKTWLRMSTRVLREACVIYGEHLADNRAEMQQGEKLSGKI